MEEELFFELADNENFIRIAVLRKSHPDATDNWDKNWVDAKVEVKAGAFAGVYYAQFRTIDFQFFRKELRLIYDNLNGHAKFEDIEHYLNINMKGDGVGHFDTNCTANYNPGPNVITLRFDLHLDQTQIMPIVHQLDRIIKKFPVIGGLRRNKIA